MMCVATSGLVFVLVVVVVGGELVVVRLVTLLGVRLLVFVLKLPLKTQNVVGYFCLSLRARENW